MGGRDNLSENAQSAKIPSPLEIGRSGQHDIKVKWNDGSETTYIARRLRLECPCAQCVDETTGVRIVKESAIPEDVHPTAIEPVGRYGISIYWSDSHSTGIYTWEKLFALSRA
jgi:DUF971 family protein